MTRNADSRGAGGFTLIEVVVALAIVALGMMALFGAVSDATSNVSYLRDRTFASWLAADRIAEIRLSGDFPSVDETSGDAEQGSQRWHWTAVVQETAVSGLRRIDVRVRRADDPDDSTLAQATGFVGQALQSSAPSGTPWQGARTAPEGQDEGPVRPPPTPRNDRPPRPRGGSDTD